MKKPGPYRIKKNKLPISAYSLVLESNNLQCHLKQNSDVLASYSR